MKPIKSLNILAVHLIASPAMIHPSLVQAQAAATAAGGWRLRIVDAQLSPSLHMHGIASHETLDLLIRYCMCQYSWDETGENQAHEKQTTFNTCLLMCLSKTGVSHLWHSQAGKARSQSRLPWTLTLRSASCIQDH